MDKSFGFSEGVEKACYSLAKNVRNAGGRALIVGGCVRDALLDLPSGDIDLEVFGLEREAFDAVLAKDFRVEFVGKKFGVYKLKDFAIDVALPRRERKKGERHCDFDIETDPNLSYEQAANRRDFTINSIAYDFLKKEIIDPFNGREDLSNGLLRHVSEKFAEDPLRVLRGMQFVGRFLLEADDSTIKLCKKLSPQNLSKERIWGEWKKLLLMAKKPSLGLEFLKAVGWLQYFPELQSLVGCEQDRIWHPEGDVWVHTGMALDSFAEMRTGDTKEDLIVGTAILCHDFGKPSTSFTDEGGRIRSPGHEKAGEAPTRSFLSRMTNEVDFIEDVVVLVKNHLQPVSLYKNNAGKSAIRRLANRVHRIDRLVRVAEADQLGRPQESADMTFTQWLTEQAKALDVEKSAPKPILQGRHLIKLGLTPSPQFKEILSNAFQAQLDGKFSNEKEALRYLPGLIDG